MKPIEIKTQEDIDNVVSLVKKLLESELWYGNVLTIQQNKEKSTIRDEIGGILSEKIISNEIVLKSELRWP